VFSAKNALDKDIYVTADWSNNTRVWGAESLATRGQRSSGVEPRRCDNFYSIFSKNTYFRHTVFRHTIFRCKFLHGWKVCWFAPKSCTQDHLSSLSPLATALAACQSYLHKCCSMRSRLQLLQILWLPWKFYSILVGKGIKRKRVICTLFLP